jgi:hypothetical protein
LFATPGGSSSTAVTNRNYPTSVFLPPAPILKT